MAAKRDKKTGRFINAIQERKKTSAKQIKRSGTIAKHIPKISPNISKKRKKDKGRKRVTNRYSVNSTFSHIKLPGLHIKKKGKITNAKTRNDNPIRINKDVPKSVILSAIKEKVKRNARIDGYRKPARIVSGSNGGKRVSPKPQRVVPGNKNLLKQIAELKAELAKLKKSAASPRRPSPITRKPLGPRSPAKRETPKAKKPKAKKPIVKGQRVKGGKKPVRRLARFDRLGKPIPRKIEFETLFKGTYSEELKGYFVTIKADVGVGWATESTPVFDEDDGETYHRVVWRTKVQASKKEAFTAYFALLGDQSNMSDIQGVPFLLRGGELCELFSDLSVHVVEKWGKKGPK